MPLERLGEWAENKKQADYNWIAVSDLILTNPPKVAQTAADKAKSGADLRAQYFYRAVKNGTTTETYDQRISTLRESLKSTPPSGSSALKLEITILENYRDKDQYSHCPVGSLKDDLCL
jgi:hypothetical protein